MGNNIFLVEDCIVLNVERYILEYPRIISTLPRPPVFSLKLLCINDLTFSRPHVTPHVTPHVRPHLRPHVGVMFSVECIVFSV